MAGFFVYVLINLVLVFSSVYIVTNFAPEAAGSGIPEIKGYLNGELDPSVSYFEIYSSVNCLNVMYVDSEVSI